MTDPDGSTGQDWEQRIAALWAAIDEHDPAGLLARFHALAAERPPGDPIALYELASAHDATDDPEQAVTLYRQALAAGLPPGRRRRAVIQLASSLRNLGQAGESLDLLTAERATGSDDLDDAVAAFQALALIDAGREREAAALALATLSPHLKSYQRSVTYYAETISDDRP